MNLLETGKIVTTHGVRGEVRAEAWSDSPEALLKFRVFYTASGRPLEVEHSRIHRGAINLKLRGYDDIDSAMALIGTVLYLDKDSVKLPEGTYFVNDLLGMRVVDAQSGQCYGELVEVQPTGANDVYHIKSPDGRILLAPAIPQVIKRVNVEAKEMTITPLEGLFDL